jgi:choline dehydrogenase-like flavoprotein
MLGLKILLAAHLVYATCPPDTFDYIIVGGGTAGLVVANRLSANPNVTVAVIEAGDSAYSNPNVTHVPVSITEFGLGIGTSVEWGYVTTPQKYTAERVLPYWAGKALGGTTTINGMTYVRAEKEQIDAWEELGNEGWDWDALWEYYLAQEDFETPTDKQRDDGASFEEDAHGRHGELSVGFTPYLTSQGAAAVFRETSEALGYPFNNDVNDGSMRGFCTWPMTLDAKTVIREDAARAFYYPVAKQRPNLHVYLNTSAARITWNEASSEESSMVASGVEVLDSHNQTAHLHATKEVIISAGSIASPALLERSGVGNPTILEAAGVKPIIPLPAVGANLQDQTATGIVYTSTTNWTGYATFASYLTAADLFGAQLASVTADLQANLSAYAAAILADYAPNTTSLAVQERLLQHQVDLVFNESSTVPLAEVLWVPVGTGIAAQFWPLLPFSRGAIHITTSNPRVAPAINPNFLHLPIDTVIHAATAVRVREFFATPPLANLVVEETGPGFGVVAEGAGWEHESWAKWIKGAYAGNSHPLGTCAMMARELGGVVDKHGVVYGASNVRVVDASMLPTQISGHLSASIYAVAGRIAGLIADKWSK